MARKSIIEKVKNFHVNPRYDATCKDLTELMELSGNMFLATAMAFRYGYLQGTRATKKELGGKHE